MATKEDLSAYTKVDSGGYLDNTTLATKVAWTQIPRNADSWIYKDKTADYFTGNFLHEFKIVYTSESALYAVCYPYVLANLTGGIKAILDAGGDVLACRINKEIAGPTFVLACYDGGVLDDYDSVSVVATTVYYVTIIKDGSNLDAYVCTGGHYFDGGSLIPGGNITCSITDSGIDYQYIYAASSFNSGSAQNLTGYAEDYDLYPQPAQAYSPTPADAVPSINRYDPSNLSWGNGWLTETVDVYLADDATYVSNGNDFVAGDKVVDDTLAVLYDPVTLSAKTLYHWRVDCKNPGGTATGDVWTFTTTGYPFNRTRGGNGAFDRTRKRL